MRQRTLPGDRFTMKVDDAPNRLMTLPELQKQALQLPINERWQLVQTLLESLQQETSPAKKKGNLTRLRGIAKGTGISANKEIKDDYAAYLTEKYQ